MDSVFAIPCSTLFTINNGIGLLIILLPILNSSKQLNKKRMASSGILRRMVLIRTDVSEELNASIIKVT
jgi:hypothetical protein